MDDTRIKKDNLLTSLPNEWHEDLFPHIQKQVNDSHCKLVVLDDDPTGTQTVHSLPVLTEWSVESLCRELTNEYHAFYVLTNSRSLPLSEAQSLNAEIGKNLLEARQKTHRQFVVASRSDSTLRGHFPGEVDALAKALKSSFDAYLLIPFFLEGGRYTIGDIHYVAEGDDLVPAAETPFARDASFGYRESNLRRWVEEKTKGHVVAKEVLSLSIEDIRRGGPDQVVKRLDQLANRTICVVNAASYRDIEVFTQGLLAAEAAGKRFLYRTSASFVRVRAGILPRPLLTRSDLNLPESGGGLVVIGSYVPRTTSQLNALLVWPGITSLAISVEALLDENRQQLELERVAKKADEALRDHKDVVIWTSRQIITGEDATESLAIGQRISEGLVATVRMISVRPRYVLAKGGITSSDVATQGLHIKRAFVKGQILPGVPVWECGPETRHPGLTYIVFPGNVGGPQALVEIITALEPELKE